MAEHQLIFRVHAIRRMFERQITVSDVHSVVATGQLIESYPDDQPYPSRLLLGFVGGRPLHVVAADIPESDQTVIITVYEPDASRWTDDFTQRRLP